MPSLLYGPHDDELKILYGLMVSKVVKILTFFYVFLDSFSIPNAHNMLTLMLDLVFKRLKFDYLAHERAKLMATKYDRKILLPMLVKCNQFLNLLISSTFPPPTE